MQRETETFDAIVVGSGISGGWAAKELTERGLRVLMLERGKITSEELAAAAPYRPEFRGAGAFPGGGEGEPPADFDELPARDDDPD